MELPEIVHLRKFQNQLILSKFGFKQYISDKMTNNINLRNPNQICGIESIEVKI